MHYVNSKIKEEMSGQCLGEVCECHCAGHVAVGSSLAEELRRERIKLEVENFN